jgi:hypothetical protein
MSMIHKDSGIKENINLSISCEDLEIEDNI